MKQLFTAVCLFLIPTIIFSQDITGLWKGTMINDSTKTSLPYELLIKKGKGKYTGISYSRFLIGGEEYYGVKKVKISKAKDGKIVIKDDDLLENNYPDGPAKNVQQLNILDLASGDADMSGLFVTNLTKRFCEVTGQIKITKADTNAGSTLINYLQKKNMGNEIAVVK